MCKKIDFEKNHHKKGCCAKKTLKSNSIHIPHVLESTPKILLTN